MLEGSVAGQAQWPKKRTFEMIRESFEPPDARWRRRGLER